MPVGSQQGSSLFNSSSHGRGCMTFEEHSPSPMDTLLGITAEYDLASLVLLLLFSKARVRRMLTLGSVAEFETAFCNRLVRAVLSEEWKRSSIISHVIAGTGLETGSPLQPCDGTGAENEVQASA